MTRLKTPGYFVKRILRKALLLIADAVAVAVAARVPA